MLPAAVRHLHIRMDYEQLYELDLTNFLLLQLVCRGVKRCQGDSSRVRLPITIIHPQLFHALLAIFLYHALGFNHDLGHYDFSFFRFFEIG